MGLGSEIPEKTYSGSRGQKGTGSRIRIRNTGSQHSIVVSVGDSWHFGADPDSTPFFIDFKDAKKNIFLSHIFPFNLPTGTSSLA